MNKEEIEAIEELINNCDNCTYKQCEQCEINWKQVQAIKKLKEELEKYKTQIDLEYVEENFIEIKKWKEWASQIDKLQKENEELKKEIENWKFTHKYVEENYIHKDKIRTKIKELEKEMNREDIQEEHFWCVEAERSVLVELLGE